MSKAQFGMIGLGTMGRNFLLNVGEQGFVGLGYDHDVEKTKLLTDDARDLNASAVATLPEFIAGLDLPRRIMMLVPAGPIVDSVIEELLPSLGYGDVIIDGGNSHFTDTERREAFLAEKGISFLGVGVSGGEEGARHGASIMAGGNEAAYEQVRNIFEAASAKVLGEPCAAHVGKSSAGHFVKMVHNGIEYAMMQLIAETYDYLRTKLALSSDEISKVFAAWNEGPLNSFLVEITAVVLAKKDSESGNPLADMLLDTAGQKGTGKWTSQAATDLGVPIPTIDSAVSMRQISGRKVLRTQLASQIKEDANPTREAAIELTIEDLAAALECAFLITYTQGMSLLQTASDEREYDLDLVEIAKIWRGGCIIRSRMLEDARAAFADDAKLESLLLNARFAALVSAGEQALRSTVIAFTTQKIPSLCFASALNYLDAIRSERLPANLIQAQRDHFGAHTYQRIDADGFFHTPDWDK
ncbi:MAG: NADP-dependent phosphogluconate dehydrogenase [Pyrinomonadaceae bacterium]